MTGNLGEINNDIETDDIELKDLNTDYLTDAIYYVLVHYENDIDGINYYIKEICDFHTLYKPNSPNGDARMLVLIDKKIKDLFKFSH